jgi:hypothetical protein
MSLANPSLACGFHVENTILGTFPLKGYNRSPCAYRVKSNWHKRRQQLLFKDSMPFDWFWLQRSVFYSHVIMWIHEHKINVCFVQALCTLISLEALHAQGYHGHKIYKWLVPVAMNCSSIYRDELVYTFVYNYNFPSGCYIVALRNRGNTMHCVILQPWCAMYIFYYIWRPSSPSFPKTLKLCFPLCFGLIQCSKIH